MKSGPLFQRLVYQKYSKWEVKDPQVMTLDHFYTITQMNGPQIFVFENFLGHTNYDKQLGAWISHYLLGSPFVIPVSKLNFLKLPFFTLLNCFIGT